MACTGKIDFGVPDDLDLRLSFGESPQTVSPKRRVIAHHLVITGYGHWLPNDIRGSGSVELCIRAHRHTSEMMWTLLTDASRKAVRAFNEVDPEHEIWTRAPYTVFLHTPDEIRDRIGYINPNPMKEGLPPQSWPFVRAYDGWPLHRQAK